MRPSTKQTITAVGVAVGATAVASIGNYLTTRYLVKIALDHEKPRMVEKTERVIEKTGRSIAGSEKNEAFLEELRAASERLAARENETVEITAHDGEKLVGHWIQAQNPKRIIIAMHGWRGSWHKDFGLVADAYLENGCSVLYAEQRGQNNSGGDYIGFGLTERYDCLDWVLAANKQYGGKLPIYLCGVSMGATTVLMAAGLDLPENVRGIIADCGYTSPAAIWKHVANNNLHITYGIRSVFADMMFREKNLVGLDDYSTVEALQNTNIPVLLIHGSDDHFVPVEMTYENYMACASPKRLLIVPGADHGMSYYLEREKYEDTVQAFWAEHDGD